MPGIDKGKATGIFLENIGRLERLPLVTDDDMAALYGEDVSRALAGLEARNYETGLCRQCQARCCSAVRCELYEPRLGQCPIHEFRPTVCRLHFCHRFFPHDDTLLKEISNVFFDGLLIAAERGCERAVLFEAPPLRPYCPDVVEAASPWVKAVAEGSISPGKALAHVREIATAWRTPAGLRSSAAGATLI